MKYYAEEEVARALHVSIANWLHNRVENDADASCMEIDAVLQICEGTMKELAEFSQKQEEALKVAKNG